MKWDKVLEATASNGATVNSAGRSLAEGQVDICIDRTGLVL